MNVRIQLSRHRALLASIALQAFRDHRERLRLYGIDAALCQEPAEWLLEYIDLPKEKMLLLLSDPLLLKKTSEKVKEDAETRRQTYMEWEGFR